ncbi:phage tail protein [Spartinivicinus ruber]|uniref:phage tail protein n=1 Tax=Spartinivicinus ruber TaxID=2683272 RepID=UPI0013D8B061|nr:phage tail protein [Spartinivicinus ruber]
MPQPMLILTNAQQQIRYRFSRNTAAYQARNRSTQYRWAKHDRISTDPALQFIGPGEDTLKLDGVIYPEYRGGLKQMESLRQEAGKGRPFLLIEGTGLVFGKYVIESIDEDQEYFLVDGQPQKITFRLTLKKYGDDHAIL